LTSAAPGNALTTFIIFFPSRIIPSRFVAVETDGNVSLNTGEHVVDALLDWLREAEAHSRHPFVELFFNRRNQLKGYGTFMGIMNAAVRYSAWELRRFQNRLTQFASRRVSRMCNNYNRIVD
jgi:hypothetical protein